MNRKGTLTALLMTVATLGVGCADPDENPRKYSVASSRWGLHCESNPTDDGFQPIANSTFGPAQDPCLELVLAGFYTRGDLTAVFRLEKTEIARTRIEFTPGGALFQRLVRQAAESRVTFVLNLEGDPLPVSTNYTLAIERAGREVARYPFAVAGG